VLDEPLLPLRDLVRMYVVRCAQSGVRSSSSASSATMVLNGALSLRRCCFSAATFLTCFFVKNFKTPLGYPKFVTLALIKFARPHLRELDAQLCAIHTAASEDEAKVTLGELATPCDHTYPQIAKSWRAYREIITPLLASPRSVA
jgi:hypothetical protein